jgi:hypothetical protein
MGLHGLLFLIGAMMSRPRIDLLRNFRNLMPENVLRLQDEGELCTDPGVA